MMRVDGNTAVERQILLSYRNYASVNASLVSPEVIYATDRDEELARYEGVIRERIERDLAAVYGSRVREAQRIYLLLGRQSGHDIVEVIRLGASDPDRSFRQSFDGLYSVGPLTYVFDPRNGAVLNVEGPVAGEY